VRGAGDDAGNTDGGIDGGREYSVTLHGEKKWGMSGDEVSDASKSFSAHHLLYV
jgi:hypothetical protein